jgi:hypothetical protein
LRDQVICHTIWSRLGESWAESENRAQRSADLALPGAGPSFAFVTGNREFEQSVFLTIESQHLPPGGE